MDSNKCLVVDNNDRIIQAGSKEDCHRGNGHLHRAFSLFIFDDRSRLLLQKRAKKKVTFPGLWSNTCCSHPLNDETERTEIDSMGVRHAAIRRVKEELGVSISLGLVNDIKPVTRIHYEARSSEEWIEKEIDHILFLRANVVCDVNTDEVEQVQWVTKDELYELYQNKETNGYRFSPWFDILISSYLRGWWDNLLELTDDNIIHRFGRLDYKMFERNEDSTE